MWKYLIIGLMLGATSCAANKGSQENDADYENHNEYSVSIQGQWQIENVVENDSSYVRPSEIEPGMKSYIDFREDRTFGIMTNCNHIGGNYTQANDSIYLTDIMSTEMACDNMQLEEMLKKVLPIVNTIDCTNDSIIRLNTDQSGAYIVLKKSSHQVK